MALDLSPNLMTLKISMWKKFAIELGGFRSEICGEATILMDQMGFSSKSCRSLLCGIEKPQSKQMQELTVLYIIEIHISISGIILYVLDVWESKA
jgi:hypothetical protein